MATEDVDPIVVARSRDKIVGHEKALAGRNRDRRVVGLYDVPGDLDTPVWSSAGDAYRHRAGEGSDVLQGVVSDDPGHRELGVSNLNAI